MTPPPVWAIAVTYWLHFIATVAWVGSLMAIAFLVLPAMKRTLDLPAQLALIEAIQRRFEPVTWFSLSALVLTGLFQMSVNPHYDGFLSTSTQWSLAILAKHFLGMIVIVVSAVQTWDVIPAIRRALVVSKKTKNTETLDALRRREIMLLQINLAVAILILAATAVARSS
ncbi:MAG: CopD family protein [Anaerolineales bacterium]|nr:CopD family protein [Anaerolineales bacterium]